MHNCIQNIVLIVYKFQKSQLGKYLLWNRGFTSLPQHLLYEINTHTLMSLKRQQVIGMIS